MRVKRNISESESSGDCELEEGACFVHHSHWLGRAIAEIMRGRSRAVKSPRVRKDLLDGEGVVEIIFILTAILEISF